MDSTKPSFFSSVMSGIAGYAKGFLVGGAVGAVIGGAIGGVIGLFVGAPLVGALLGATWLGGGMAAVGAIAGAMTGVVRNRERGAINEQDVVNLANIAFAQGVTNGIEMSQNKTRTDHAERYKERKAATEQSGSQIVH